MFTAVSYIEVPRLVVVRQAVGLKLIRDSHSVITIIIIVQNPLRVGYT